jgi:DNA-binding response OmpR family regulator
MSDTKNLRILVAEQSPAARQILAKLFEKAGYQRAIFASDLNNTWQIVRSGKVDLLVIDWKIASNTQYTLLKRIRKLPKKLPILAMVSKPPKDMVIRMRQLGADRFITVPFGPDTLGEMIRKTMNPEAAEKTKPETKKQDQPAEGKITTRALMEKAQSALAENDFANAAALYAQALKQNDLLPEAHKGMADAVRGAGDQKGSQGFMNRAAEVYVETDRDDEAEDLYLQIREENPEAPNPFKTTARKFKTQGRRDRGVQVLERASALSPEDDEVVSELARDYIEMDKKEQALDLAKSLLERGNESPLTREIFFEITGSEWYYGKDSPEGEIQILDDAKKDASGGHDKRGAKRIAFADRSVRVSGSKDVHPVVDMSATGIGFKPMSAKFKVGQKLTLDVLVMGDVRIKKVKAVVRRSAKKIIGCEFTSLSSKQSKGINSMVD